MLSYTKLFQVSVSTLDTNINTVMMRGSDFQTLNNIHIKICFAIIMYNE